MKVLFFITIAIAISAIQAQPTAFTGGWSDRNLKEMKNNPEIQNIVNFVFKKEGGRYAKDPNQHWKILKLYRLYTPAVKGKFWHILGLMTDSESIVGVYKMTVR